MLVGFQNNLMVQYHDGGFQDFDGVCCNYGNPANSKDPATKLVRTTMLAGYLNSHATTLYRDPETKRWLTKGNMSEGEGTATTVDPVGSLFQGHLGDLFNT